MTQTLTKTLLELLNEQQEKQEHEITHIPSFNQDLDEVLNGGIPLGQVTQLVGFPGIGKSQLWFVFYYSLSSINYISNIN